MAALKKMPGHPRLYRREATYYFRAAIPADIADTYPKTTETHTLGTKDYQEALRLVRIASVEIDRKFDAHRRRIAAETAPTVDELTPEQLKQIKARYYQFLLEEDEEARLDGFRDDEEEQSLEASLADPRSTFNAYSETQEAVTQQARRSYARGKADGFFRDEAEEVLGWDGVGIRLAPRSPTWPRLVRALQEASIEAGEAVSRRNEGQIVETPQEGPQRLSRSTTPLLSHLFSSRLAEAKAAEDWGPKVENDYRAWTAVFIEEFGDRGILQYSKDDARRFKTLLMGLPSNRNKHTETAGKSASECVAIAERLELPRLSVTTINKALSRLQATWIWSNKQLDENVPDIFGPMKIKRQSKAKDEKDPFSAEQLKTIFGGPVFNGCESERYRATAGTTNLSHTSWYWLPLLSLYSGARLNELCQLGVDDVRLECGISYLALHEDTEGQRIKGHRSRDVPIHSTLVELGLLDFAEERGRRNDVKLFPALKQDAQGYYSSQSSKDFAAYITRIGAKTPKTSFHSFRHNFRDACRNNGVHPDIASILVGHSLSGMEGRYGSGKVLLERLHQEIEKVAYPELDLSGINRFMLRR